MIIFGIIIRATNTVDSSSSIALSSSIRVSEPIEKDGMIRVAKTKYRPSYYRKQLAQTTTSTTIASKITTEKTEKAGKAGKTGKNIYSAVSRVMTEPLLTWCLRFPPRDETCIACLLITLSVLFTLPVLSAVFDECYRDLCAVILRYRFHKSAQIRRGALQLFISTTQYVHREGSSHTRELEEKDALIQWMNQIVRDDPDDSCRSLASSLLYQLTHSPVCSSVQSFTFLFITSSLTTLKLGVFLLSLIRVFYDSNKQCNHMKTHYIPSVKTSSVVT